MEKLFNFGEDFFMIENSKVIKENTDKFSYIKQNNKKTFLHGKKPPNQVKKQVNWFFFYQFKKVKIVCNLNHKG